jgi:hypothetical protein
VPTKIFVGEREVNKPLEDIGVDGKVILEWIFRETEWEGADLRYLAHNGDHWCSPVKVKVATVLLLIKHHAVKAYWGS